MTDYSKMAVDDVNRAVHVALKLKPWDFRWDNSKCPIMKGSHTVFDALNREDIANGKEPRTDGNYPNGKPIVSMCKCVRVWIYPDYVKDARLGESLENELLAKGFTISKAGKLYSYNRHSRYEGGNIFIDDMIRGRARCIAWLKLREIRKKRKKK